MSKLALPRVANILHERKEKIDCDLGDAFAKRKDADDAAAEYEKTLADAKAKAQALAQQTHAGLPPRPRPSAPRSKPNRRRSSPRPKPQIEATKANAMANVEPIAQEAASAIVEHMTGQAGRPEGDRGGGCFNQILKTERRHAFRC